MMDDSQARSRIPIISYQISIYFNYLCDRHIQADLNAGLNVLSRAW